MVKERLIVSGSRYRDILTTQILELKENRVVDELKEKWWRNKDNITCEV